MGNDSTKTRDTCSLKDLLFGPLIQTPDTMKSNGFPRQSVVTIIVHRLYPFTKVIIKQGPATATLAFQDYDHRFVVHVFAVAAHINLLLSFDLAVSLKSFTFAKLRHTLM